MVVVGEKWRWWVSSSDGGWVVVGNVDGLVIVGVGCDWAGYCGYVNCWGVFGQVVKIEWVIEGGCWWRYCTAVCLECTEVGLNEWVVKMNRWDNEWMKR